ncbi:uncharacterized protein LODBEIA_P28550 [Lodderomyces beijingensis]|uniref:Membrane-anchored lipid-binding protein SIP3 n=1 Tax=Lodderomyces beijingensis TaxID=1775926 RepID=A0ABP0ZNC8_9ASCO
MNNNGRNVHPHEIIGNGIQPTGGADAFSAEDQDHIAGLQQPSMKPEHDPQPRDMPIPPEQQQQQQQHRQPGGLQDKQAEVSRVQQKKRSEFKLISVSFKEAALDSPSFRAAVNHMDLQINNIENWLLALSSSIKKIPRYVKEVENFCNSFLEHLVPGFLQDGMIDQEYTVQALHATLTGLKSIWSKSLFALTMNPQMLSEMSNFKKTHVVKYRESRKRYEACQSKYDKYLALFVSTSKSKDAVMVVEDAKQLHQVRRDYIHVSLDMVEQLQDLANKLDILLVSLNSTLWEKKWSHFAAEDSSSQLRSQWEKVRSVQAWCDSYSLAIDKLRHDMSSARKQVEDGANHQYQPSLNPHDYNSSLINYRSLTEIDETGIEKHGYLFMKTWIEKSSKPIWVRRWCFIKDGVFGMLLLSPSQTFVQESDKIGILLCNIKYSPNEDRRFCFEIKTSELTITLQAESIVELKSWLKVFDNERTRITGQPPDSSLFQVASNRFPPILSEFASTVNTTMDHELSNLKIINSVGQTITSSSLSRFIGKFEKFHERHLSFQIPRVHPPIMTDTTKSAIIAYSCIPATVLPTALTANIWGSVNWGLYYLYDSQKDLPPKGRETGVDLEMINFQETHLGFDISYPDFYPKELINFDIQMRAMFESSVQPGEYCVMSYGCIWAPNSKQELTGRCFLTPNNVYFYNQALGFVALYKGWIGRFVSVECTAQKDYDLLKIYDVEGVIKLKLFLEDGNMIKRKLSYLINNMASDKPKRLREVLLAFSEIEKEVHQDEEDQRILKKINELSKQLSSKNLSNDKLILSGEASSIIPYTKGTDQPRTVDFRDQYDFVSEYSYPVPPKALFHAFLGDDSAIFRDDEALTKINSYMSKSWRNSELTGKLYRQANLLVEYHGESRPLHFEQQIDTMDDNEYYTFTNSVSEIEFFIGAPFQIVQRFVIVSISGKRSKVFFYVQINFKYYSIWNPLVRQIAYKITEGRFRKINRTLKEVVEALGHRGTIVKAIYLYGKLSHTRDKEKVEPIPLIKIGFLYSLQLLINKILRMAESYWLWIGKCFFSCLKFVAGIVSANYVFIAIIIGLLVLNIMLVGKSSMNYWTAHNASSTIKKYMSHEPLVMQRAVYSKDVQTYLNSAMLADNRTSQHKPFKIFLKASFLQNFRNTSTIDWGDYFSDDTLSVAKNLRSSFQDIGVKRHELLVQLKILNQMEKELAVAEYVNWLMSEIQRCDYMQENIFVQLVNAEMTEKSSRARTRDSDPSIRKIMEYCRDCRNALNEMI